MDLQSLHWYRGYHFNGPLTIETGCKNYTLSRPVLQGLSPQKATDCRKRVRLLIPSHAWWCRATGQHEQADELLQRCLYALEMALHPFFQWGEPGCRIPFEEEHNRPLFSALFKHMQVGQPCSYNCKTGNYNICHGCIQTRHNSSQEWLESVTEVYLCYRVCVGPSRQQGGKANDSSD